MTNPLRLPKEQVNGWFSFRGNGWMRNSRGQIVACTHRFLKMTVLFCSVIADIFTFIASVGHYIVSCLRQLQVVAKRLWPMLTTPL